MFAKGAHYTVLFIATSKSNLMAVLMRTLCLWGRSTINLKEKIHQFM